MPDFIVVTPGIEDRVLARCDGDTNVLESPVVYFTAELLLAPMWPFTVHWDDYNTDGITAVIVKAEITQHVVIWRLTGKYDDNHDEYEGRWPD